jgi:hypothetical protein
MKLNIYAKRNNKGLDSDPCGAPVAVDFCMKIDFSS